MRAAVLRSFGGPEALRVASDVPVPSCGPREVLVRVAAASVNPLDCRVRAGYGRALYEPMLPLVLGRDVSGEVVARGDAARAFPLGAAVFGALSPVAPRGTHAEYVAVPEAHLARVPPGWSHIDAAAVPFAALTAWRALFTTANLRPGERLLVLGAGGAVGAAATHLASRERAQSPSRAPSPTRRDSSPTPSTRGTPIRRLPDRSRENTRLGAVRCRVGLRRESRANAPRRDCFVRVSVAS